MDLYFVQVCLDEGEMKGKEIIEEFFFLCGKVKEKKKIMLSNDNFTLMLL